MINSATPCAIQVPLQISANIHTSTVDATKDYQYYSVCHGSHQLLPKTCSSSIFWATITLSSSTLSSDYSLVWSDISLNDLNLFFSPRSVSFIIGYSASRNRSASTLAMLATHSSWDRWNHVFCVWFDYPAVSGARSSLVFVDLSC